MMDFFCPKTGLPIGWAFTYVPRSLYCRECKRDHSSTEMKPRSCEECGGSFVYGETGNICARCQVMNDAENNPEFSR